MNSVNHCSASNEANNSYYTIHAQGGSVDHKHKAFSPEHNHDNPLLNM